VPQRIPKNNLRPTRTGLFSGATLVIVVLALTACGGSSSPSVAHLPTANRGTANTGSAPEGGGLSSESPVGLQRAMIAYATCMRSNGVPNFPDPNSSGGFVVHGLDRESPAFRAAQTKCRRLLPPGPGSGPPPSRQTLARFLNIARCMRQHGVSDFPDPRTSAPPGRLPSGISELSDIEGVILLFPSTIDQQSPTFTRASAACAFPLHNH
jgi:hypothetical protein